MFSLLTEVEGVAESRSVELALAAIDLETLLVDWLNELLYRAEDDGIVFRRFAIHELDTTSGKARMAATAWGGRPAELVKTIKAATFSSLQIERDAAGYRVDIVFDV